MSCKWAKGSAGPAGDEHHNLIPVPYAIQAGATRVNPKSGPGGIGVQSGIAYTLEAREEVQCIAFPARMSIPQAGIDVSPTLVSKNPMAVSAAFNVAMRSRNGDPLPELGSDLANALSTAAGGSSKAHVLQSGPNDKWAVRRLTPLECERLMGFPDNYTNVPYRGKPATDSVRYRALGNSWAINCARWIGERIRAVDAACAAQEAA